jgi:hypothetical protein
VLKGIHDKHSANVYVRTVIMPLFYVIVLVVSLAYVVDSSFNPFLYFRF